MFYVYILQNDISRELYIGYTSDLRRRVVEHNAKSKKYTTRTKGAWKVAYYEAYRSQADAMLRESKLKQHGSGKRELYKRISQSL